jgi:hypothetical protein
MAATTCSADVRVRAHGAMEITAEIGEYPITQDVSKQANTLYDEDYDQDNLHMTPNSVKNQDSEQLEALEMVRPEDFLVREEFCLQSGDEEDWEIMHSQKAGITSTC